jgi:hypothetical protein
MAMRSGKKILGLFATVAATVLLSAAMFPISGCTDLASRPASPGVPYSIVALPDTQYYSKSFPEIFMAQTRWIVANKKALNICFVTHEGDIADDSRDDQQWSAAVRAMDVLNGQVPYATCPGNHDEGGQSRYASYAARFGPARYAGQAWAAPWYGGASDDGANSWQKFQAGGRTFLAISLAYEMPPASVAFARRVLEANPGLPAILTTHGFLVGSGERLYGGSMHPEAAEMAWKDFISESPQIFLVLCGHTSESRRVDNNRAGLPVVQLLADYQNMENGGNGFLRIMTFDEKAGRISVKTYSPTLDRYRTEPSSQFDIDLDLAARFKAGAAAVVVAPAAR